MVSDLSPNPLTFKFTNQLDKVWNSAKNAWDERHPYLYLEVHVDREKGHYFGSWSKRRKYDDEVMDTGRPTLLDQYDIDVLLNRTEINMQHPAWSSVTMRPKLLRAWPEN